MASLPPVMTTNLLLTLGILCPLTFLVGLLVTHRIAGPAYRMEQYCLQVARAARETSTYSSI